MGFKVNHDCHIYVIKLQSSSKQIKCSEHLTSQLTMLTEGLSVCIKAYPFIFVPQFSLEKLLTETKTSMGLVMVVMSPFLEVFLFLYLS